MRILNVTQSYAPFFEFGGPPVKVRALAEGLAERGHQVTVLTADWGLQHRLMEYPAETQSTQGPFGHEINSNGVTTIYLPNWFHYRAISWNPALGRFLRARLGAFDIVHIFGLYDLLGFRVAAECRNRNIPYVVEPIGMFVPIVRNLPLKRVYHRLFGGKLFAGAAAIIATADQEKTELIASGISKEKIVVRRNGVDVPASFPSRGSFRASLQIPDDAKLLLFLGRLSAKKSPDLLLRAFADVFYRQKGLRDRLQLAFVGPDEGGMLASLQSNTSKLGLTGAVHFVRPLSGDAKWSAYRDANIFVLPSQNENFGNTAAESVAAGTPVILSDQCGIAPLLADIAGLAVPHNQAQLAEAIESLLLNDSLYRKLERAVPPQSLHSIGTNLWTPWLTFTELLRVLPTRRTINSLMRNSDKLPISHRLFLLVWRVSNCLLIIALIASIASGVWEYSVRHYLRGFSDAIVPEASAPVEKVQAILAWMRNGPPRLEVTQPSEVSPRDPQDTLNYRQLLTVCGSATNAFEPFSERGAGDAPPSLAHAGAHHQACCR